MHPRYKYLLGRVQTIRRSLRKFFRTKVLRKPYFVSKINGLYFLLDSSNYVDRNLDFFKGYETEQIQHFTSLIRDHQCTEFLDIGAHGGLYSLMFANEKSLQPLNITAFEPDRINRYQLCANLFMNRMERIVVRDFGLSNKNSEISFSRDESNRGKNKIHAEGNYQIKIQKGDDLLKFTDKSIALKIDVEGHEFEAIEGIQNLLKNNICVLQVESFGDDATTKLNALLGSDYKHLDTIGSDHYFTNSKTN